MAETPEKTAQEEVVEKLEKTATPKGFKITKVANRAARTINLGQFNSVRLSAEMEIVFDEPQDPDSPIVVDAFNKMRELNRAEWYKQMEPYRKKKEEKKEGISNE